MDPNFNNRILTVDDNPAIHDDFAKILPTANTQDDDDLNDLLAEVLDQSDQENTGPSYTLDHAYQGDEALDMIQAAEEAGNPYALVFMDVRMPPGMDGIETILEIWKKYPHVECVICTAFSDYSWDEILANIGGSDQLQFLRKPFDVVSIKQMALALTTKWNLAKKSREYTDDLEREVAERTQQLNEKVQELQKAIDEISQLQGIIPMCAYCHKIRDDSNFWSRVDEYLQKKTPAEISHGICPECYDKVLGPMLDATQEEENKKAQK